MSLRQAINAMCRECIHDPLDVGGPSHQIAACTNRDCPLHPVRPITCTQLPMRLLRHWQIDPADLDERARVLITAEDSSQAPNWTPTEEIDPEQYLDKGPEFAADREAESA